MVTSWLFLHLELSQTFRVRRSAMTQRSAVAHATPGCQCHLHHDHVRAIPTSDSAQAMVVLAETASTNCLKIKQIIENYPDELRTAAYY